jgi:hypothetical protein
MDVKKEVSWRAIGLIQKGFRLGSPRERKSVNWSQRREKLTELVTVHGSVVKLERQRGAMMEI